MPPPICCRAGSNGRRAVRRLRTLVVLGVVGATVVLSVAGCGGGAKPAEAPVTTTPAIARLRIIFPEGFNVAEMGTRVADVRRIAIAKRGVTPKLTRAQYLAAARQARPPKAFLTDWKRGQIEGFLFPALYEFSQYTTGKELVADQLEAFRRVFAKVSLRYARSKNLTPYDVLKIASMIEKETVAPRERRLVAAVIYNRLHAHVPLGIDATIRYGLRIPGTRSLTKTALSSASPYNSRRFPGLPPTPIANPGLASIQAAAHPAKVDYLYYVRIPGTKRHFFTASEAEFLRKVCAVRLRLQVARDVRWGAVARCSAGCRETPRLNAGREQQRASCRSSILAS